MNAYINENATDWEDDLEWEPIDSTPEMVLGDPILEQQKRLREERQKVEEADHKLTEELFVVETGNTKKHNITELFGKMKSSSIKLVDDVIKRSKIVQLERPKISRNKKKIYDEYTLNQDEAKSLDFEEKFFNNRR